MLNLATQDKLHSADSAAELLGVRPATIRWWWAIGRVPRLKIGRLSRVRESALLALIECEHSPCGLTRAEDKAGVNAHI